MFWWLGAVGEVEKEVQQPSTLGLLCKFIDSVQNILKCQQGCSYIIIVQHLSTVMYTTLCNPQFGTFTRKFGVDTQRCVYVGRCQHLSSSIVFLLLHACVC